MSISVPQEQLAKDTDDFFTLAEKIKNIVHYGGTKESYDTLLKLVNDAESYNEPVKTLLINNLKNKGISAINTETMTALVNKINNIKLGQGNAIESDVIAGKQFTNSDGILRTGNIINRSTIPSDETAHGIGSSGSSIGRSIGVRGWTPSNGGVYYIKPSQGYYDGNDTWTYVLDNDFKPENILSGKTIFGLNGAASSGKKFVNGNGNCNWVKIGQSPSGDNTTFQFDLNVSGLPFKPTTVMTRIYTASHDFDSQRYDIISPIGNYCCGYFYDNGNRALFSPNNNLLHITESGFYISYTACWGAIGTTGTVPNYIWYALE